MRNPKSAATRLRLWCRDKMNETNTYWYFSRWRKIAPVTDEEIAVALDVLESTKDIMQVHAFLQDAHNVEAFIQLPEVTFHEMP